MIALRECSAYLDGFLTAWYRKSRAFWINPPGVNDGRLSKANQLITASDVGFVIPRTLISNDPHEIRSFVSAVGGKAAFKLLQPAGWQKSEETPLLVVYTTIIDESLLQVEQSLQYCPAIFQAVVPKDYEVRVLYCGNTTWSIKLNSQEIPASQTDWRRGQGHVAMQQITLPSRISQLCRLFCKRLGIVHCSFDFVVRPDGEWVFLEINEQGQFLWLETRAGVPALDGFTDFLISRDPDFTYSSVQPTIQFDLARYTETSEDRSKGSQRSIVVAPD